MTCDNPNHSTDSGRNTSGAVIVTTSTTTAAVVSPRRPVASWVIRSSSTIARPVSRLRSRGVERSITSGPDADFAHSGRLAVEEHFDVVLAGGGAAGVI